MNRSQTSEMYTIENSHTIRAFMAICLFLVIGIGCGGTGDSGKGTNGLTPTVEAVQARYGKLPLSQRLSGRVEGRNQIGVYPELSAVIVDVLVKDGDTVQEGDVLVRLRDREFRERLNQAMADAYRAMGQPEQATPYLQRALQ